MKRLILTAWLCVMLAAGCAVSPEPEVVEPEPVKPAPAVVESEPAKAEEAASEAVAAVVDVRDLPASERLGRVLSLSHPSAVVYVPDSLVLLGDDRTAEVDVVVHFHLGLDWVVEALDEHEMAAVLVYFSPGGLSSKYRVPFASDPGLFDRLVEEGLAAARAVDGVSDEAEIRTLTVTSFSAGFGAVREVLKDPEAFARIDHLVMADTIYAGYEGEVADKVVRADHMADFKRFAAEAAAGRKAMIVTHNSYDPPGYASTEETADVLIEHLGLERYAVDYPVGEKLRHHSRAGAGRFEVFGSPRTDGSDHAMHLKYIAWPLGMLGLGGSASGG